MKGVIRVECAVCGPVVECKDQTLMEAFATRHEREYDGHKTELVLG